MKSSLWKRLLSYLIELHVESAPSAMNPHLYVSLAKGRYQLSTANAVYSYEDLYDNFYTSFQKIVLPDSIQKVLILGFGLGSIPLMLEKKFKKKYYYTGVEADENVLYLAHKYALPELQSGIQLICADANAFVHYNEEKYDLICMDVFLDDKIPTDFESIDFLKRLTDLLTKEGVLLYNRLANTKQDIKNTISFYENNFLGVFPKGRYLDVNGNWMLINEQKFIL